ncbi:hypothetical protein JB92DRAFT_3138856 [Gautieria morchelliformis]|nr:hypothetical protein JB92DRAFT_3138856 [Gautieria morchelliformis]
MTLTTRRRPSSRKVISKFVAESLTDDKHTGQHPVALSSKSAVKAPPEALEALFSSKSNPTRPPGSTLARRAKPFQKDQGTSVEVLHHHPSDTAWPLPQEPHRTRDHVDSPHPTVPADTTLTEQTSKPEKGKGVDPLERGWPGMFKDRLLNTQHAEVAIQAVQLQLFGLRVVDCRDRHIFLSMVWVTERE